MEYYFPFWSYVFLTCYFFCNSQYELFWRIEGVANFDIFHGSYWMAEKVRYRQHKKSLIWERKTKRLFVVYKKGRAKIKEKEEWMIVSNNRHQKLEKELKQ